MVMAAVLEAELDLDAVAQVRPSGEMSAEVEGELVAPGLQRLLEPEPAVGVGGADHRISFHRLELDHDAGRR